MNSTEPKPAKGEWTYEKVAGLLGMSEERASNYNLVVLRDAINAALAAEREGKITQPKPATGAWTEGRVTSLLGATDGIEGLVYEINAALAAEREGQKHYRGLFDEIRQALGDLIPTDASKKEIIDKVKQLAAERDEHDKALLAKQTRIEIFQQQLAALEGVLAEDTGKAALAAAIKESYEKGRKDEQGQSSTLR